MGYIHIAASSDSARKDLNKIVKISMLFENASVNYLPGFPGYTKNYSSHNAA